MPQVYGIYDARDVGGNEPMHVNDAFGWVLTLRDSAYLVQHDPAGAGTTFGSFSSTEQILRTFGRRDPLAVLTPDAQPVWPDRLTTDNAAFALTWPELLAYAEQLRSNPHD